MSHCAIWDPDKVPAGWGALRGEPWEKWSKSRGNAGVSAAGPTRSRPRDTQATEGSFGTPHPIRNECVPAAAHAGSVLARVEEPKVSHWTQMEALDQETAETRPLLTGR